MTTKTIAQPSPVTSGRRMRRPIIAAGILVLAMAIVVVAIAVSGIFASTAQNRSGDSGADNSYCRPTAVVHIC